MHCDVSKTSVKNLQIAMISERYSKHEHKMYHGLTSNFPYVTDINRQVTDI